MKNAIILHGRPSRDEFYDHKVPSQSNAHWIPWLQGQLVKNNVAAATPEVPKSFELDWDVWRKEVERFEIGPETILVGHSTGAGFFIKYLSINQSIQVGKVVLVAPWINTDAVHDTGTFFDFEIDPELVKRSGGITVFNSDNDRETIHKTVKVLRNSIKGLKYKEFYNYGHFLHEDMGKYEFPELLEEVLL
jgi:predicted alpha/beta hydrolase family esterase